MICQLYLLSILSPLLECPQGSLSAFFCVALCTPSTQSCKPVFTCPLPLPSRQCWASGLALLLEAVVCVKTRGLFNVARGARRLGPSSRSVPNCDGSLLLPTSSFPCLSLRSMPCPLWVQMGVLLIPKQSCRQRASACTLMTHVH